MAYNSGDACLSLRTLGHATFAAGPQLSIAITQTQLGEIKIQQLLRCLPMSIIELTLMRICKHIVRLGVLSPALFGCWVVRAVLRIVLRGERFEASVMPFAEHSSI